MTSPSPAGLQPERTALAWQRTAVTSCAVLIAQLVLVIRQQAVWLELWCGALALAGGVLTVRTAMVMARHRQSLTGLRSAYDGLLGSAAVIVLAALSGATCGVWVLLR